MVKLTWPDLLIEEVTHEQFRDWIAPWKGIVVGRVGLVFLNKFGSWFLRRPEGPVEMLDVFTGEIVRAADTYEDFVRKVNERWWQEENLFSELVFKLHQVGTVPGPGQCYAVVPHPALGGPNPADAAAFDPRNAMVMDIGPWQLLCAQFLGIGN